MCFSAVRIDSHVQGGSHAIEFTMTELHLVDLERDALDAFFIILHSFSRTDGTK